MRNFGCDETPMKRICIPVVFCLLLVACAKEEVLTFQSATYSKKSNVPCTKECPDATVTLPIAAGVPVVADSINKRIFDVIRNNIIVFGEQPYEATDFNELLTRFMASYDELPKDDREETGWSAKVEGRVAYESDSLLNIELRHYIYEGGAHGYSGRTSLLFNPKTGKAISQRQLFRNKAGFKAFAEKKFRETFHIAEKDSLNSAGFMFEHSKFVLPQTYIYTDKGFLLYYNVYEIASYAEGPKEVLIPYDEMKPYLLIR